jgi:hypothetical protein
MALDDFLEPEVGIAIAVTAAVASPGARKVIRKGLVYGLAGVLMLGDKLKEAASSVAEKARQVAATPPATAESPQSAPLTTEAAPS